MILNGLLMLPRNGETKARYMHQNSITTINTLLCSWEEDKNALSLYSECRVWLECLEYRINVNSAATSFSLFCECMLYYIWYEPIQNLLMN